jgi:hypothetical protein
MNFIVAPRHHSVGADSARLLLLARGREIASWPLPADHAVDIELVDRLARCELAAERAGWHVRVRGARRELVELLEFVGLGELLLVEAGDDSDDSEVCRQPEGLEQPGVEEVVQPDDPAI